MLYLSSTCVLQFYTCDTFYVKNPKELLLFLASLSHQLGVFHWSLRDSKSPQVSRYLSNQVDSVVWMVSIRPPIFLSFRSLPVSFSHRFTGGLRVLDWVGITASLFRSPELFWLFCLISVMMWSPNFDSSPHFQFLQSYFQYYYFHFPPCEFFTPVLVIFHWSLNDSKSPKVSGVLLNILANLCPVGWGCRIHWLYLYRGVRPPNWVSWYDTKQSDGEVLAVLKLWGMRSTPLLTSLPDKGPIYGLNRTSRILMLNWIE